MKNPNVTTPILLDEFQLVIYSDTVEVHSVQAIQPYGVLVNYYEYNNLYKQDFKKWANLPKEQLDLINKFLEPQSFDPEKFTEFSKRNLRVIQNFLVYAQIEDEYAQTAINYIAEDHVDGEDSPEAILEIALGSEMIIEESYGEDDPNEERPLNVYANDVNGLIYEVDILANEVVGIYKLTKPQEVIEVEHRYEILSSVLAKYTKDDEVYLRDIFSHGTYIEKIYPL